MNKIVISIRMGRLLLAALSLFFIARGSSAQDNSSKAVATVKFHSTKDGLILVDASFGGRNHGTFVLDTGASTNVIDQHTAQIFDLKSNKTMHVDVEGTGPTALSSQSWAHIKIAQKHVILAEGDFPALDLSSLQEAIGVPISGVLGSTTLQKYVVSIDYSIGEMSLFDSTKWSYTGDGQTFAMRESGTTHMFIIDGSVVLANCETVPLRLDLDSGSNYSVVLNHHFLESHPQIPASLEPHDEKTAWVGSGGLDGKWVDLNSLKIGSLSLKAPDSFALKTDSTAVLDQFADALIGTKILQQFKVIVDFPESKIIFEQRRDVPLQVAKPCR